MRSVTDLLRTYNFVNTPEGQRGTVRFFAALAVLAAGGFMVFFIAFGGGSDTTYQSGAGDHYGPSDGNPFDVSMTSLSTTEYYIGYPTALYDPDNRHLYTEGAIEAKLQAVKEDYGCTVKQTEPITSPDEHEVLMGYLTEVRCTLGSPLGALR